jgi:SAM-dependent methyltransferase
MGRLYDATWGRLFSACYDRGLKASEEAGLRQMRRQLLAQAQGRVVELGAGTGLNLEHYPTSTESLTLVEPDPHMSGRLRQRLRAGAREATVVEAPAESLPFAAGSFDTAVVTLVLCTVPDPTAALSEIGRVLAPGGQLLFLEHVRAREPGLASWQDRLERPWRFFADGCHCNRDTLGTIEASALQPRRVEHCGLPKAFPIVRPMIVGSAARPTSA